jgi:hypothetical protein
MLFYNLFTSPDVLQDKNRGILKYRGSEQGDKLAGNLNRFNATNDFMEGHEMGIVDNPDLLFRSPCNCP